MVEKILMLDLNDPKIAGLADVISNKTCKKILELLAEKEMSESDIVKALNLPSNTINYNVKKLVDSGLIEKTGKSFWSVKGRKIEMYKLSNKKIVISPKKSFEKVFTSIAITSLLAFGIKVGYDKLGVDSNLLLDGEMTSVSEKVAMVGQDSVSSFVEPASLGNCLVQSCSYVSTNWAWFLFGALCALLIYLVLDYWRFKS